MSKTPEGRVKDGIKKLLQRAGAYYHMPVQNGMGRPSLDFIGCHQGRFFGIEAKAGNKDATERQKITAKDMQDAGGTTFVVNEHTGLPELRAWLGVADANQETRLQKRVRHIPRSTRAKEEPRQAQRRTAPVREDQRRTTQ